MAAQLHDAVRSKDMYFWSLKDKFYFGITKLEAPKQEFKPYEKAEKLLNGKT